MVAEEVVAVALPEAKAKAQPGHRATAPHLRAAMARKLAPALRAKVHHALTLKPTAGVKADEMATGTAAVAQSSAATRVLTIAVTAQAAPQHAALALRVVAQVADLKGVRAV